MKRLLLLGVTLAGFAFGSGFLGGGSSGGSTITASRAAVSDGTGAITAATTTATEIGYVNGVTSAIQTQLGLKAPLASPSLTGTPSIGISDKFQIGTDVANYLSGDGFTNRVNFHMPSGSKFQIFANGQQYLQFEQTRALFMDQSGANAFTTDLQPGKSVAAVVRAGGIAYTKRTPASNTSTGETDLQSQAIGADYLAVDGSTLVIETNYSLASNANAKTMQMYWNGVSVGSSGALAQVGGVCVARMYVMRLSATTQQIWGTFISGLTTIPFVASGSATLSGAVTWKSTGTGGATTDITQNATAIYWYPGI